MIPGGPPQLLQIDFPLRPAQIRCDELVLREREREGRGREGGGREKEGRGGSGWEREAT